MTWAKKCQGAILPSPASLANDFENLLHVSCVPSISCVLYVSCALYWEVKEQDRLPVLKDVSFCYERQFTWSWWSGQPAAAQRILKLARQRAR